MTVSLLSLPDDLLLQILRDVGRHIWDLPAVALTCKRLAGLVYDEDDQTLWRELHSEKYDNPFQAAAFLEPRTEYPWRTAVIERSVVARYFDSGALKSASSHSFWKSLHFEGGLDPYSRSSWVWDEADYMRSKEEAIRWGPRILRVAYGLFVDMPGQTFPSRNAELLSEMFFSPVLEIIVDVLLPLRLQLDSQGKEMMSGPLEPHSDLTRMAAIAIACQTHSPMRQYTDTPLRRDWRRPMGILVDWQECIRTAKLDPRVGMYVDDLRGDGLLNLGCRPSNGAVWDWADVRGEWLTQYHGRVVGGHRPAAVLSPVMLDMSTHMFYWRQAPRHDLPLSFELVPVSTRDDVNKAFNQVSTDEADLWYQFPDDPPPRSGIPPLFFHSTHTDTTSPFVYGMVSLSKDEPPELEWILGVWYPNLTDSSVGSAVKREDFIIRGVQMGGRGSRLGVRGPYGPRSWGPQGQLYSSFPNIAWDSTMVSPSPDDGFYAYGTAHLTKPAWFDPPAVEIHRDDAQQTYDNFVDLAYDEYLIFNGQPQAPESLLDNWWVNKVNDEDWDPDCLTEHLEELSFITSESPYYRSESQ